MQTLDDFLPETADATGGSDLEVLQLSETPALVTIFTNKVSSSSTHYVDFPNLRSELRCNTGLEFRCLLCDLKYRLTKRAILPVYDVASAEVKVLLVSDTRDPHSLGPQLTQVTELSPRTQDFHQFSAKVLTTFQRPLV